jgi:flagellar basal-body rod modification protein FlgD
MVEINSIHTPTSITGQANVKEAVSELGSDVFLRLLVTQLKSQDPTNPVEDRDFVAQLAQFTTLEQATNTNSLLNTLIAQNVQRSHMDLVSLLGRAIVTEGNTVGLGKESDPVLQYSLSGDAANVSVEVLGPQNQVLRTLSPETLQVKGNHHIRWDGQDESGDRLPEGIYGFRVKAQDSNQQPVPSLTFARERVTDIVPGTEMPVLVQSGKKYNLEDIISIQSWVD